MAETNLSSEIKTLRDKGYSYRQIQSATNASLSTISYHLGEGQKNKTKVRTVGYRKSIDAFIRHSKETNPCVDCNNFYPYYVMQYDHRPEFVKCFNISRYKDHTQDLAVVKLEMQKCDLVCANCHMIRGHWRRQEAKGMIDSYEEEDF